jgi:hypothetical protein
MGCDSSSTSGQTSNSVSDAVAGEVPNPQDQNLSTDVTPSNDLGEGSDSGNAELDLGVDMTVDTGVDPSLLYPTEPGGNPIDPTHALFPFPSDFFLVQDEESETGWRLSIPMDLLSDGVPYEAITSANGFSRLPIILSGWPRGVDQASLPSMIDHGESIEDTSTTLLIEHETFRRIPHLAEVDVSSQDPQSAPLIIRPLILLKPNHSYSVVIRRGLRDLEGMIYEPNPAFLALRDDVETNYEPIEQQKSNFAATRQVINESGGILEDVILAWSFRTRSGEQTTQSLLHLQDFAHDWPLEQYEITQDEVRGENRQLQGTFIGPNFVGPDGLVWGEDGRPIPVGTASYPFTLTIPRSVEGGETAPVPSVRRPVILYGHGFLGERQQATRSTFNELCREGRYSAVGINFGFHEGILRQAILGLTGSSESVPLLIAEVMQTMVNASVMIRYLREQISQDFVSLDPEAIHYMGISNGGTFGYLFGATTLEIERAVFVVGGAGLSHFLQRATQWSELGYLVTSRNPHAPDLQIFLSLLQMVIDPVDPANYMDHLVEPRFAGRPPLRSQLHMALHDSQVHNLVTEWVARSANIPMITPSPKEIWGLDTITAPLSDADQLTLPSALYVYDEGVEPSPIGNIPAAEDNRTHNTVRELDVYKEHIIRFLDEGRIQQVCDGACDPQ